MNRLSVLARGEALDLFLEPRVGQRLGLAQREADRAEPQQQHPPGRRFGQAPGTAASTTAFDPAALGSA